MYLTARQAFLAVFQLFGLEDTAVLILVCHRRVSAAYVDRHTKELEEEGAVEQPKKVHEETSGFRIYFLVEGRTETVCRGVQQICSGIRKGLEEIFFFCLFHYITRVLLLCK